MLCAETVSPTKQPLFFNLMLNFHCSLNYGNTNSKVWFEKHQMTDPTLAVIKVYNYTPVLSNLTSMSLQQHTLCWGHVSWPNALCFSSNMKRMASYCEELLEEHSEAAVSRVQNSAALCSGCCLCVNLCKKKQFLPEVDFGVRHFLEDGCYYGYESVLCRVD